MLPNSTNKRFPEALKAVREAKGLSYTDVAKAIGINPAMPSRYENPEHSCFCAPRDSTWHKLNDLFFGTDKAAELINKMPTENIWLGEASVEQMIQELKARGATAVSISY